MEIGARLAQLELSAGDPQALARFYASTFRLETQERGEALMCSAPGRQLVFVPGPGGQLQRVTLRFQAQGAFEAHRTALHTRGLALVEDGDDRVTVRDPHGHLVSFLPPDPAADGFQVEARLQHFALRTPQPLALSNFYIGKLGFAPSDRVLDERGELTAIFLRSDGEHHTLAIFRAPEVRFDHFSCEVADWLQLRDWADHMARVGVDLAWGVGRHGPGNDTFFMVRDAEGNMGEISAELEVCQPGRPVGIWPHRPQTLNQWGVAIMRS